MDQPTPISHSIEKAVAVATLVVGELATILGDWGGHLPHNAAQAIQVGLACAYMLSRGLGKMGAQYDSTGKNPLATTEFFVMVLMVAKFAVANLAGVIPAEEAAQWGSLIGGVYMLASRMSRVGDPGGINQFVTIKPEDILAAARKIGPPVLLLIFALGASACSVLPAPPAVPSVIATAFSDRNVQLFGDGLDALVAEKKLEQSEAASRKLEWRRAQMLVRPTPVPAVK